MIAETGPEFAACFFGTVYAGAWPVPLPLPTSFAGREAYVAQLAVQLKSSDPALLLYPAELADFCKAAAEKAGITSRDWESLEDIEPVPVELPDGKAGRHRLSAIFERFDPFSARCCGHALRAAPQPPFARLRPQGAARRTASSRGCRGTMTWAWSAASSRRSRCRCRSIFSKPRISPAGHWPGSTSLRAIRARRSATRRRSAMTSARGG